MNESSGVGLTGGVSYNRPGSGVDLLNGTGLSFTYNVDGGNLVTDVNVAGGQLLSYDSSTGQFDIDTDKFQQGLKESIAAKVRAENERRRKEGKPPLHPSEFNQQAGENMDSGVATIMAAIANGAGAVSDFVTDTIPNAIAGAASAVAGFVTETIPGFASDTAQSVGNFFTADHNGEYFNWETDAEQIARMEQEIADVKQGWYEDMAHTVAMAELADVSLLSSSAHVTGASGGSIGYPKPDGTFVLNHNLSSAELADPTIRGHINNLRRFETPDGSVYERGPHIPGQFSVFACSENCAQNGKTGETFLITPAGAVVQRIPSAEGGYTMVVTGPDENGRPGRWDLSKQGEFALAPEAAIKGAAILNWTPVTEGGIHGYTELLGVRLSMRRYAAGDGFQNSSVGNGNSFEMWADGVGSGGTKGEIWRSIALAASANGVSNVTFNTANYGGTGTHSEGAAMDLNSMTLTTATGDEVCFNRLLACGQGAATVAAANQFAQDFFAVVAPHGGYVWTPNVMYGGMAYDAARYDRSWPALGSAMRSIYGENLNANHLELGNCRGAEACRQALKASADRFKEQYRRLISDRILAGPLRDKLLQFNAIRYGRGTQSMYAHHNHGHLYSGQR